MDRFAPSEMALICDELQNRRSKFIKQAVGTGIEQAMVAIAFLAAEQAGCVRIVQDRGH